MATQASNARLANTKAVDEMLTTPSIHGIAQGS